MGAPKPPTTEIEIPDPLIVKQYTPRSVEYALGEAYKNSAANAALAGAKRDAAIASLLGKPYSGTFDSEGEKIDITRAPTTFDPGVFFDPAKNMYLAEEIEAASKRSRNKRMRRMERMENKEDERMKYLQSLNEESRKRMMAG